MQQQHALEVSSEFFDLAGDTAQRLLASGGTLVSIGAVATGYGGAVTTEASDHVMDPVRPERNINAWPAFDHCTIARADHDIMLGICTYAVVTTLPQDLIAHSPSMSPVEHNGKTITGAQNGRFLLYVRVRHDMIGIRPEPVLGIIVRFHKERLDYKTRRCLFTTCRVLHADGPELRGLGRSEGGDSCGGGRGQGQGHAGRGERWAHRTGGCVRGAGEDATRGKLWQDIHSH